jgi:hypothetical protein
MEEKIKFEYNGKNYSFKPSQIVKFAEFYEKMQVDGETYSCPLCGCDFIDNNLFVCETCNQILDNEEKCTEHTDEHICKECCEYCQKEVAYDDYIDSLIDADRDGAL